ncbi:hypothetical protein FQN53_004053 [Emmonsiellopsis sp. PD_33]|nr:hypothetical protein FQN53_004053 [Emmonsiellopsis sp. PD_33]
METGMGSAGVPGSLPDTTAFVGLPLGTRADSAIAALEEEEHEEEDGEEDKEEAEEGMVEGRAEQSSEPAEVNAVVSFEFALPAGHGIS